MSKKNKKKQTECGEFVPTFFSWQTLDEQKKTAEKLSKITKNNK